MPNDHKIPISRDDLTFTVHMALRKAERLWPKRRKPGDHDRLHPVADAVAAHIGLCGIRCFRRAPERGRTTPDPWGRHAGARGARRQRMIGPPDIVGR